MNIHAHEPFDFGAYEPVCTVAAPDYGDDAPRRWSAFQVYNTALGAELQFHLRRALAFHGGAAKIDTLGVVPALLALYQPQVA